MRIGELARAAGISAETVRFYEREGLLPTPPRGPNGYRDYGQADIEHVRLLTELRKLDVPLAQAARVARWCHTGHCQDSARALPEVVSAQRAMVRQRIERLRLLEQRLADLERHLASAELRVVGGACCGPAAAVIATSGCTGCAAEVTEQE